MNIENINTLGKLKESKYTHRSVKEELRDNLIKKISKKELTFPGIIGYEDSVIPETERAPRGGSIRSPTALSRGSRIPC